MLAKKWWVFILFVSSDVFNQVLPDTLADAYYKVFIWCSYREVFNQVLCFLYFQDDVGDDV